MAWVSIIRFESIKRFLISICETSFTKLLNGERKMQLYDTTQIQIVKYLQETQQIFTEFLERDCGGGNCYFVPSLDLGFPHDVIRIAGGFATGAYFKWSSKVPIVPIDTCVNDCAVSIFEVDGDILSCFTEDKIQLFKNKIENSIYKLNFHRGNHFISVMQSKKTKKVFLLLHSSANEFKDNYNGLYPVEENYFWKKTRVYTSRQRYFRYLLGADAELFWKMSEQLPKFNEIRQEFLASALVEGTARIINANTYHHYFMPDFESVIMGGHVTRAGDKLPLLTGPSENIFMLRYDELKDNDYRIPDSVEFITPHGLGKYDINEPKISISMNTKKFSLDGIEYDIRFGESLRAHPNLKLRPFEAKKVFGYLNKCYKYTIEDEFIQLLSWNKAGIKEWNTNITYM